MNKPTFFRIYILTIYDANHPRVKSAAAQLKAMAIPFEFVAGIRPNNTTLSEHHSKLANLFLMKRSLGLGEICCYIGHRKMWQQYLNSDAEHALFLEDDFNFIDPNSVITAINDCLTSPKTWDVIKLFDYRPKKIVFSQTVGTTRLVAYKYPASGNVAYVMNRKAATALLKRQKIFRPVDDDMSHMWEFGIRIWSVDPNLVTEISDVLGGSTMETERVKINKRRSLVRGIWGTILQLNKLVRSLMYRRKMKH